jgi:hypothetical protein
LRRKVAAGDGLADFSSWKGGAGKPEPSTSVQTGASAQQYLTRVAFGRSDVSSDTVSPLRVASA